MTRLNEEEVTRLRAALAEEKRVLAGWKKLRKKDAEHDEAEVAARGHDSRSAVTLEMLEPALQAIGREWEQSPQWRWADVATWIATEGSPDMMTLVRAYRHFGLRRGWSEEHAEGACGTMLQDHLGDSLIEAAERLRRSILDGIIVGTQGEWWSCCFNAEEVRKQWPSGQDVVGAQCPIHGDTEAPPKAHVAATPKPRRKGAKPGPKAKFAEDLMRVLAKHHDVIVDMSERQRHAYVLTFMAGEKPGSANTRLSTS